MCQPNKQLAEVVTHRGDATEGPVDGDEGAGLVDRHEKVLGARITVDHHLRQLDQIVQQAERWRGEVGSERYEIFRDVLRELVNRSRR